MPAPTARSNGAGTDRDRIRAGLDVEAYYRAELGQLRGRGEEREAFCPFHENTDTPALGVNVRTGLYVCRNPACAEGGDVFKFHMKRHGSDFTTALRELASRAGVVPDSAPAEPEPDVIDDAIPAEHHRVLIDSPAYPRFLSERRGLTLETATEYQLGHDGQRFTIPVRDELGRCVNIRRYKPHASEAREKMISWREGYGAARLYPVREALLDQPGAPVVLVEGEWDALIARQSGINAVTCTGGAGTWRDAWTPHFRGRDVVIWYDRDDAGRAGARTVAAKLARAGARVRVVDPGPGDDGSDITDFIVRDGWAADQLRELIDAAEPYEPAEPEDADTLEESRARFTDAANAERLAQLHGGRIRYVPKWGDWLMWNGTVWTKDDRNIRVQERAKDVGRDLLRQAAENVEDGQLLSWAKSSLSGSKIRAMIELARGIDGITLDHEALDTDPWLLGVQNGAIELKTGTLRDADPADLMMMQAPVEYDPEADAPRWGQALREWFPDADVRAYVQRLAGAALVGLQRDHVLVIHYGGGRNGKGSFVRAMQRVLGPYATVPHLSLLIQSRKTEHDTVKAELFRARLAVASETDRRVKLAEAQVKNLTGGDRITARRLYENPWEFNPTHSLWLQTNYLPEIAGRDRGIWSRIRVVPWTATFEGNEADPDLDEKLATEAPGILRWAVEGCLAWQEEGLQEPDAVMRATLEYRHSEDVFARFVADEGLVLEPDQKISVGELSELRDGWAAANGLKVNVKDFNAWLEEQGCTDGREYQTVEDERKRVRIWWGIGLPDPPDPLDPSTFTDAGGHRERALTEQPQRGSESENPETVGAQAVTGTTERSGTGGTTVPQSLYTGGSQGKFSADLSHLSHSRPEDSESAPVEFDSGPRLPPNVDRPCRSCDGGLHHDDPDGGLCASCRRLEV